MTHLRRLLVAALVAASMIPGPAPAVEPERPGQDSFLTRAVVAQGRLWVLSDAGVLSSVVLDSQAIVRERTADPVLDVCVSGGSPVLALASRDGTWTIERRVENVWIAEAKIRGNGDRFVALDCSGAVRTVLTNRHVVESSGGTQRATLLSKELVADDVASVFGNEKYLFVGINAGEWGGGLRQIDRMTGAVTIIEKNDDGQICSGPLNTDCDPVTSIASDPWDAGCLVIGIGLEHMVASGRVDEVCGKSVRSVYSRVYPASCTPPDEICGHVAFFGLAARGDAVVAVGNDGIYRIQKDGEATVLPLPAFVSAGGIYLSYGMPGFVLVLSDVNKRRSVSASVPLLVAR